MARLQICIHWTFYYGDIRFGVRIMTKTKRRLQTHAICSLAEYTSHYAVGKNNCRDVKLGLPPLIYNFAAD